MTKDRSYFTKGRIKGHSRIRSQDEREYDIPPQREPLAKRCTTSPAPNKKGGKQWKLEFLPFSSSDDKVVVSVSVISLISDRRNHATLAACGSFLLKLFFEEVSNRSSRQCHLIVKQVILNYKSLAIFVEKILLWKRAS